MSESCLACDEVSGDIPVPGDHLEASDQVAVFHCPIVAPATDIYAGYLFVVPRRHVPGFSGLTDDEAEAVGARSRAGPGHWRPPGQSTSTCSASVTVWTISMSIWFPGGREHLARSPGCTSTTGTARVVWTQQPQPTSCRLFAQSESSDRPSSSGARPKTILSRNVGADWDSCRSQGLGWSGTRTGHGDELAAFYESVLGLQQTHMEPGFWVFRLPDGRNVEVFGTDYPGKEHFNTGPVVGFAVRDLKEAVFELQAVGVELLGQSGPTWQHFRGPDGNVYELVAD